ncbi:flagellar basal body P-ring protein FlgI [Pikeienuella piscinae]|uniref:Flagellar P-ring protein n=1 Tax=Pikeienuella piscinae TaxID=2748098 RepID=A0A7M3T715_9RHOB|nr:flagellar basal body P-ring protein FlgI [Pikeienuella piscinae]QIE57796.1 flagellar basal body P-ring protein FlgI [Pikeienuella piscinae]
MLAAQAANADVRIKDLVEFDGVRGNDLVGYGLVVGLPGTGDGIRNSPFTEEALANLLERLGININGEQIRPKNVAAVLVTAELPAFARAGRRIDVSVSAIGDAESLRGGTLIMTPLNAADGRIYAVAQGPVLAGGVTVEGDAASITRGVPTGGVIPDGARVELEIDFEMEALNDLRLALRDPDFTTASRIARSINRKLGANVARMQDSGTVLIDSSQVAVAGAAQTIARIENIRIDKEQKARVVIDQRSGTIVLGDDVRISRVAIAQGDLTLRVRETPVVSQPSPFGDGETVVVPRTEVGIEEQVDRMAIVPESISLANLVEGLNALGVSTRQMIDILSAVKAAGALHAEFVLQ